MDYNKRLIEAQRELYEACFSISAQTVNYNADTEDDWNYEAWEMYAKYKKRIAKKYNVHEGDLKYK